MKAVAFAMLLLISAAAPAETISAKRIKALRQLHPLKKVTVGPEDQFQAAVSPDGKFLVFTHKADLVAHLRLQNLDGGKVIDLLPLDADSQDASFGADGRLTFTYYKFNARGDICYIDGVSANTTLMKDSQIRCLVRPQNELSSERSSPFWKNSDELGYVVRDINTQNTRIVTENIRSHQQTILAEGKVWAPTLKPGGRYLVYSSVGSESGRRFLVVKDLSTGKNRRIQLSLPGISGFSAVSDDERYVYFSHFLEDTNQDNAIDGNDNSVIFRISIARIFAASEEASILPEQLTSVESSCSFPRPFTDQLYVTCAFEGTLDIYQIPAAGIVPTEWDVTILNNALQTARSYPERMLILNTIRFRQPQAPVQFDLGFLSDHILAGDTQAARFYLSALEVESPVTLKPSYDLLRIYLQALEFAKVQPPGEISNTFQAQMQKLASNAEKIKSPPVLRQLVHAHILRWLGEGPAARKIYASVHASTRMERYLSFQLADGLFVDVASRPELLEAYHEMIKAPELSEESRIYYAFNVLRVIQNFDPKPAPRMALIKKLSDNAAPESKALLDSELTVLQMVAATDDKAQMPFYGHLDDLMRAAAKNYFLRKAMNVRAILNFNKFAQFKFLNVIAANWLRDTAQSDTEFIYAREVVFSSSLDQAYGMYGQKNYALAANFFYQSLTLTDDLESHAGYIRSEIAVGQRKILDQRYQYLVSHNFIDDNQKYVSALLSLIDGESAKPDDSSTTVLDAAIKSLESMTQDRDSALRYLLVGYAYLEKLRRITQGIEIDNDLFQKAHRALMLAYDQGRDNDRVRAAALVNLGLLHQRAGNFGLSAKFLSLRKKIGFENEEDHAHFAWYYARSLFHSYQIDLATRELREIPEAQMTVPLRERLAFYSTMSGDYKHAVDLYAQILQSGQVTGDLNTAKINLAYGYALKKAKRESEAITALSKARQAASHLKIIPLGGYRVLEFEPIRIELIAAGLLGQMGSPAARLQALQDRAQLIAKAKDLLDSPETLQFLNSLHMVEVESDSAAARDLKSTLKAVKTYGDANGFLGNAVFRTTVDYLVTALQHPALYQGEESLVRSVVEKNLAAIAAQKPSTTLLEAQRLKLEMLWNAYLRKVEHRPGVTAVSLSSDGAHQVESEMPVQWRELQALAKVL